MSSASSLRPLAAFATAAVLFLGAAACSSDDSADDIGGPGIDAPTPAPESESDDIGAGGDDGEAGEETPSGDAGVTATIPHGNGTASIDEINDACAWIEIAEVEDATGASGLDAAGFGIAGMDIQCEYEIEDGSVWVQMVYKRAEDDLDLTEEFSADIPTIEWVEELDGIGDQAVALEGPMESAQVDIVDGDLWVMANVMIAGDGAAAQQAAVDLAARGIRLD